MAHLVATDFRLSPIRLGCNFRAFVPITWPFETSSGMLRCGYRRVLPGLGASLLCSQLAKSGSIRKWPCSAVLLHDYLCCSQSHFPAVTDQAREVAVTHLSSGDTRQRLITGISCAEGLLSSRAHRLIRDGKWTDATHRLPGKKETLPILLLRDHPTGFRLSA